MAAPRQAQELVSIASMDQQALILGVDVALTSTLFLPQHPQGPQNGSPHYGKADKIVPVDH